MTTENDAPAPESAAPEPVVEQPKPAAEAKPPAPTVKQPVPDVAPIPGTRHVLNEKTGMYDVVREDAPEPEKPQAVEKDDEDGESAPAGAFELVIPEEVVRQGVHGEDDRVLVDEASAMLSAAGYTQAQQDRLVDIYAMESGAHANAPRAEVDGQDAVIGYLKEHWGSEYEQRLDAAVAMTKKMGPKFEAWLGETGLGDDPTMLSVLANVGRGLLSISKEDAQRQITEIRKSFQPYGKDHKLTVAKLRVLTERVARGEPNPEDARLTMGAALKKGVREQISGGPIITPEPPAAAKDLIGTLRETQAAVFKQHGRLSPEYKAISTKLTAAYEKAYGVEPHKA